MRSLKLLLVLRTPLKTLSWALQGAGCCGEHVSCIIPSDAQDSPKYHYCAHVHMGKPRHKKWSHVTRKWLRPLETQVCLAP